MSAKRSLILDEDDIRQKTRRIAYEVIENNYKEKELVVIGIKPNGYHFAEKLANEISGISDIRASLHSLEVDKHSPEPDSIILSDNLKRLNNKVVLLVDDVANTGRTLFHACIPLLEGAPKKLQVAVLVDRKHKLFPICSDYVGLSLATTMKEHVVVDMKGTKESAYLEE